MGGWSFSGGIPLKCIFLIFPSKHFPSHEILLFLTFISPCHFSLFQTDSFSLSQEYPSSITVSSSTPGEMSFFFSLTRGVLMFKILAIKCMDKNNLAQVFECLNFFFMNNRIISREKGWFYWMFQSHQIILLHIKKTTIIHKI